LWLFIKAVRELDYKASNGRINGEYGTIKDLEGSDLEVSPKYFPERNEVKQGDICQDVQCPNRDQNQ
jgi:hypothetical protein